MRNITNKEKIRIETILLGHTFPSLQTLISATPRNGIIVNVNHFELHSLWREVSRFKNLKLRDKIYSYWQNKILTR